MNSPSLLLIDLQRDFVDCSAGKTGKLAKAVCIPSIRRLLEYARACNWTIVHVMTVHDSADTLPDYVQHRFEAPYCVRGTSGADMIAGLKQEGDVVVEKRDYSAFLNTNLDDVLADSDQLVVAGIAADCCIFHTAADASMRDGKEVYLPYQAVSASESSDFIFGLRAAAKSFAVVTDLDSILTGNSLDESVKMQPDELTEVLAEWFDKRANVASRLESQLIEKYESNFLRILDDLESELSSM